MNNICIIPARGGSKRIPRKNIKDFCGSPILSYSIRTAIESQLFNEVMVSTDDKDIANIAIHYGASIPFLRKPETSNDMAGLLEVVIEVINTYRLKHNYFDNVCCLLPTAPFVKESDLEESYISFVDGEYDSLFPVVRYGYPIYRSLSIKNGRAELNWPEHYFTRSQDLPIAFHDAGQFYWINVGECEKKGRIFTDNSGILEIPEVQVQDIDTYEDWEIAEIKYKILQKKSTM